MLSLNAVLFIQWTVSEVCHCSVVSRFENGQPRLVGFSVENKYRKESVYPLHWTRTGSNETDLSL